VIGAGIIGASIAWHLVRAGATVTVIDGEPHAGGVATPRSFAWINAAWGNPEWYVRFRRRSMAGWTRLNGQVADLGVEWCGGLLWDLPEDELRAYAEEHAAWGYGIRLVGAGEARRIEPRLVEPPVLAVHVAEEGAVEPVHAARQLLAASGARRISGTRVASLVERGGAIRGVVTTAGDAVEADETVVAAGTGAGPLLESVGVRIGIESPPGLIAHSTVAKERLLEGLVMSPAFHARQTREGRVIAGADFAGGEPGADADASGRALLEAVKSSIRGAEALDLAFTTVGHRPSPADGYPVIGRPRGMPGLYVAVMHSGVTLAPIVGELAAREIVDGRRDADLGPYDPDRPALA
jgi:glycine/D-amino acid oxidase-like deaminating enzyme